MHDDRIVKTRLRTDHVSLTCVNHPSLRWSTKNIGGIGARSIFFLGERLEDGSFKRGSMYPGSPLKHVRNLMNGKNPFNEEMDAVEGSAITTWEKLIEVVDAIKHDAELFAFECDCPAGDLTVAPEVLEGSEVDA